MRGESHENDSNHGGSDGDRRVIEGAGHNLPEEAAKEFADAVAELAARTATPRRQS